MEGRMLQQGSREEIARAEHCATWSCREHVQSKEQAGKKGPKSMESERGKDPLKTVGWYHLKEKMGAAKEHLVNPCFPENLGTELDDGRCAGTEEISHPLSSLGCLFDGPGSQRIQDFCIKWAWLAFSPLLVPVLWVSALRKMSCHTSSSGKQVSRITALAFLRSEGHGHSLHYIFADTFWEPLGLEKPQPQQTQAAVHHMLSWKVTAAPGAARHTTKTWDFQEKTKHSHCNLVQEKIK